MASPHLDVSAAAAGNFFSQSTQMTFPNDDDDDPVQQRVQTNEVYKKSLETPANGEEQEPTCRDMAKLYIGVLEEHYQDLTGEFVRQELADEKTFGGVDEDTAANYAWLLRMGMDQEVYRSLLEHRQDIAGANA